MNRFQEALNNLIKLEKADTLKKIGLPSHTNCDTIQELLDEFIDIKHNLGEIDSDINLDYLAYVVSDGITHRKLNRELDCDLDIVFKALKEGIVVSKHRSFDEKKFVENEERVWFPTVSLTKIKISNTWAFECCTNIYELKDYQKTWWLVSDKKGE